jgi:hypothetical protein
MAGLQVRPERDHVADLIRAELSQALDTAASRAARAAPGLAIVTDPLAGEVSRRPGQPPGRARPGQARGAE